MNKKTKFILFCFALAAGLTTAAYLLGPGFVVVITLQLAIIFSGKYWAESLLKNVIKSHEVLGKNQKVILRKISQIEEDSRK